MPLSDPVQRDSIHTRRIECRGYRRADGLWDIEGHLIDTKTYEFQNFDRGSMPPGTPVHEMWLRLTVDDDLVIRNAEAAIDHGPYRICPRITENFAALAGIRIRSGWRREINRVVGGTSGCTHLRELLGPVATTAFQTIYPILRRERPAPAEQKPPMLGTCHAYAPDSAVVKRLWPDYYEEKKSEGKGDSGR